MERAIRECLVFPPFLRMCVLSDDCSASNPVLDLRYWKLLQAILIPVSSKSSKTGPSSNTWLLPLLNRVPLLPIVLSLLTNSLNLPVPKRDELYLHSSKSLALVWSLAAPKFSPDNLLESFGAVLRVLNEGTAGSGSNTGLVEIGMLVTSSLHTALSNSSNKKKVCLPLCKVIILYRVYDTVHS
jgi:hypothetical protein